MILVIGCWEDARGNMFDVRMRHKDSYERQRRHVRIHPLHLLEKAWDSYKQSHTDANKMDWSTSAAAQEIVEGARWVAQGFKYEILRLYPCE